MTKKDKILVLESMVNWKKEEVLKEEDNAIVPFALGVAAIALFVWLFKKAHDALLERDRMSPTPKHPLYKKAVESYEEAIDSCEEMYGEHETRIKTVSRQSNGSYYEDRNNVFNDVHQTITAYRDKPKYIKCKMATEVRLYKEAIRLYSTLGVDKLCSYNDNKVGCKKFVKDEIETLKSKIGQLNHLLKM